MMEDRRARCIVKTRELLLFKRLPVLSTDGVRDLLLRFKILQVINQRFDLSVAWIEF